MQTFIGWLLIVMGVLIAGAAGTCSLAVLGGGGGGGQYAGAMAGMVAVIGGIPLLVGVAMIVSGWFIVRGPRKPRP